MKLVVLDDHRLFRIGLKMVLNSSNFPIDVVGEAATAKDLFNLLQEVSADILLLDINLPDMHGRDVAKEVKALYPNIRILVLSADVNPHTIYEMSKAGISGYISKNASNNELITAIEYVAENGEYYGRDISEVLKKYAENRKAVSDDGFTKREIEIITLSSKGFPAKKIAEQLGISLKTVFAHKYNIFKKIGINNSVELTNYAFKNGLIKP